MTLLQAQFVGYTIDDTYIRQANIVNKTYIKPNLRNDRYLSMEERSALLRLDVLLTEISDKRHPQHRAKEIIDLSNRYIALNKKRDVEISLILKELKQITDRN